MTRSFKHIRTSILPCGHIDKTVNGKNIGFYRFSLCIDLNPTEDLSELTIPTRKGLETFLRNYQMIYKKFIEILPGVKIFEKETSKNIQQYPRIISHNTTEFKISDLVNQLWLEFLKNQPSKEEISKKINFPEKEKQLDISLESTSTLFNSDEIPKPENFRKLAISAFEKAIVGKQASDFNFLQKTIQETNTAIDNFDNKLNGISDFAQSQNAFQTDKLYKRSLGALVGHESIFDSVDSILEVWSFFDSNSLLQRLFGKTIDFEISDVYFDGYLEGELLNLKLFKDIEKEMDAFVSFFGDLAFGSKFILSWEHLPTPIRIFNKEKLILVDEHEIILKEIPKIKLEASNYDVGGKLIGLKTIRDKFDNYLKILNDKTTPESQKYNIRKQLISLDTAALTIGINAYNSTLTKILEAEKAAEELLLDKYQADEKEETIPLNYLYRIRKGFRYAVKSNVSEELTPIGKRKVRVKRFNQTTKKHEEVDLPIDLSNDELAISGCSGSHAFLLDDKNNLIPKVILDEAMINWSGENIGMPSVFSNQENEDNFQNNVDEGSISDSTKIVSERLSHFYVEEYKLKGVNYFSDPEKIKNSVFVKSNTEKKEIPLIIEYSQEGVDNKKLVLGRDYNIILTPEYKNGWAIPFEKLQTLSKENNQKEFSKSQLLNSYYAAITNFTFKRNEPVKPIEFQLQASLSDVTTGKPTYLRQGESLDKLVIRNLSDIDDNKVYKTQQQSIRHILPPAISFQQAFWHNKIFEMTTEESYIWYMKYHFPAEENKLMKWNLKGEDVEHLNIICTIEDAIKGSTIMRSIYPKDCQINYLPDPLSIGFRFEFYKDKNRLIKAKKYERFEQLEFYFTGKYPKINAWKLILEDINLNESERLSVNLSNEEVTIRLEIGDELFISARTILSADYEMQFETFGNYNDFTRYGNNDLLTPPLEFSLIHATQRPLVRPKFGNIIRPNKGYKEKKIDKTIFETTITSNIEQTGIYYDETGIVRYLEENIPTGNIELYAKWEEYKDDAKHVTTDNWTPNEPINHIDVKKFKHSDKETPATFETAIEVSKQLDTMEATLNKIASDRNDFKNYAVDLKILYDVKETKFIEKYFWIKNKSKFTSYYPKDWGTIDENTANEDEQKLLKNNFRYSKEFFNRLSSEAFLVRILNSKKPNAPIVADKNITLVSVIEDRNSNKTIERTASMNRLRFFFERGRLTSGKGERIGFVLNEPKAKYNNYLVKNDLVSIVGRDIVSDSLKPYDGLFRNEDVLLTKANFVINDPYDLKDFVTSKKSDDLQSFSPKYVKELGLMTYLPKFDKKLNLWYLDVEMDINDDKGRELHSPFLRFSIVHYQEHSFNYNLDTENDITKDCRVSEINKSRYVYILPSRNIKIEYGKIFINEYDHGYVIPKLSFDISTVKGNLKENVVENESKFYLLIRHKRTADIKWYMADKDKVDDGNAFYPINTRKDVEKMYFKYYTNTNYQIVILETEDWGNDNDISFDQLIENKNSRIIHVNTFEINI